ncbi:hypothetical protein SpCBS45565_g04469 [Spizellomyces sp. 'palustris']|nr:hypothetical protein SpCBS45565_g04469 [Spizellomyces sp. 'palustris']
MIDTEITRRTRLAKDYKMGAKSSKKEPIVIYNEPDVAIQFSPNLLRKLEGQPPDPVLARFSGLPTPPPPPHMPLGAPSVPPNRSSAPKQSQQPAVESADIDKIVKQRVEREIELHQQKRLVHEQRSADQVRREVEDLLKRQKM